MEEEGRGGGGRKPRVVIIGAGMAGIAAAQRLQKQAGAGRYELTILEASDRIGGRICSSEFNGEGIELGATWIHGIEGSPLFSKAVEMGAMENAERAWEGKDGFLDNEVLIAEGGLEVPKKLVERAEELYKHMLLDVQEMGDVQPKAMVAGAGAAAIDASSVKFSDLCGNYGLGVFLRQGLDRFLAQQTDHQVCLNPPSTTTQWDGVEDSSGCSRWTTKSLQEGSFRMHENLERSITAADDLNDIDLVDFHEYWEFPGEHRTIAKGYSSLVRALAYELPPGVVRFGHNVERIVWSDDSSSYPGAPVRIHCQGGSVVEADHVILTVSLGVLKASTLGGLESSISEPQTNGGPHSAFPNRTFAAEGEREIQLKGENGHTEGENGAPSPTAPELFDPPLPMWKLESISKLGFGVVDKVFVQIEPAEKRGQHRPLQFIFHPTEVEEKQSGETIPAWMRKTFSLYPIHKNSHVLLAWFTGKEALQVESLTDEEIINGISKTFTGFGIPEDQQGAFVNIKRSKWGQNPLFRGSYSYVKVGSTGKDIDTLAEPLPRLSDGEAAPLQLLFAGEATHRHYYSTTHGAYFSGLREAERLLQHYGLLAH